MVTATATVMSPDGLRERKPIEVPIDEAKPDFDLPVDLEWKATKIKIYSVAKPHMRAFQLAWVNFFMTFIATFAPSALVPIIRENLSFTRLEAGTGALLATMGAIGGRLGMGTVLDVLGPRMGNGIIMLMFAPPVFLISLITNASGYQAVRFFIGMSLCCFVACQFWVGSMFNAKIVGTANAITAGWGNMGGGVTLIMMPAIYSGIKASGVPSFEAWRWAFFVPGGIFLIMGVLSMMFSVDSPRGDYRDLKKSGVLAKGKGNVWSVIKVAMFNYRSWIFFLTYGYSFGVELVVDNVIVTYFYDQFELDLVTAGGLGALFGLMNLFTRATGGMLSDLVAIRFGMRGRLWCLWIIQTLGGVFCVVLGLVDYSLGATLAVMIIFSIFCQQACGAHFGIVPFVSRRSYGVVSGIVGAGGNTGAVVTQTIFFAGSQYSPVMTIQDGLVWMGVMTIGMTATLFLVHFPQWGSMLFPGNPDITEEDYYLKEWTAEEVALGLHNESMRFAMESRSQRGYKPDGSLKPVGSGSMKGMKSVVEISKTIDTSSESSGPTDTVTQTQAAR